MTTSGVRAAAIGAGLGALVLVGVIGVRGSAGRAEPSSLPSVASSPVSPGDGIHPSGIGPTPDRDPRWSSGYVDDFTGSAPSPSWYLYSGKPASGPGGFWARSHVLVTGGELRLRTSYEQGRWVSGGLARLAPAPMTYGKVQVRFRMAPAVGVSYALLMWPDDEKWPPEIDFGEDGGGDRALTTATLHHAPGNTIEQHQLAGDFSTWHTLGIEWTPGHLDYTVDGQAWGSDTGDGVPSVPMHLALQTQTWGCGLSFAQCPDATTPAVTDLEVDWVTVQGYLGGS